VVISVPRRVPASTPYTENQQPPQQSLVFGRRLLVVSCCSVGTVHVLFESQRRRNLNASHDGARPQLDSGTISFLWRRRTVPRDLRGKYGGSQGHLSWRDDDIKPHHTPATNFSHLRQGNWRSNRSEARTVGQKLHRIL
jgi:hypothetical protein